MHFKQEWNWGDICIFLSFCLQYSVYIVWFPTKLSLEELKNQHTVIPSETSVREKEIIMRQFIREKGFTILVTCLKEPFWSRIGVQNITNRIPSSTIWEVWKLYIKITEGQQVKGLISCKKKPIWISWLWKTVVMYSLQH